MEVSVIDHAGNPIGQFDFGLDSLRLGAYPPQRAAHVLYLIRTLQLSRLQQGTHKAKTRGEVSGGGKKPYKQKGTGNARMGSTRTPLRVGGGVVFGPVVRDHAISLNRKVVKLGYRLALSNLIANADKKVYVFAAGSNVSKTSLADSLVSERLGQSKRVILITGYSDDETRSFIGFRNLQVVSVAGVNTIPIERLMQSDLILFSHDAAETLKARLSV